MTKIRRDNTRVYEQNVVYSTWSPGASSTSSTPYSVVDSWIETDSLKSPMTFETVVKTFPWKPRNGFVKVPKLPSLKTPKEIILQPRRPNQSNRSWNKAQRTFEVLLQNRSLLIKQRELLFQRRMANYHRKLALLEQQLKMAASGRQRKVRKRTAIKRQDNPYSRTTQVQLPVTGVNKSTNWYQNHDGSGKWGYEYLTATGYQDNFLSVPWGASFDSDEWNALLVSTDSVAFKRYMDKLGAQSVHIANIIAERAQTAQLIGSISKSILRNIVGFSWKRLTSNAIELLSVHKNKQLANATLAFLFGVKPLMNDIYEAATLLTKKTVPTDSLRAKGVAVKTANYTRTVYSAAHRGYWTFTSTLKFRTSYKVDFAISNPAAFELQSLGLINPAEVLWEKMPWSFVIDWILPIGNWIHSLTSDVGLTFKGGTYSKRMAIAVSASFSATEDFDYGTVAGFQTRSFQSTWFYEFKERTLLTSPPGSRFPSFKSPISLLHITETLALIRQQLRR